MKRSGKMLRTMLRGARKETRTIGNNQGFTLLELIVAISILTVGILAVASMQMASIRGNAFAGGVTEGTNYAADRLEKLASLAWNDSDLSAGSHTDASPPTGYTITWVVTDNWPYTNTKRITLTAAWTKQGSQKSVVIEQIIPRII